RDPQGDAARAPFRSETKVNRTSPASGPTQQFAFYVAEFLTVADAATSADRLMDADGFQREAAPHGATMAPSAAPVFADGTATFVGTVTASSSTPGPSSALPAIRSPTSSPWRGRCSSQMGRSGGPRSRTT